MDEVVTVDVAMGRLERLEGFGLAVHPERCARAASACELRAVRGCVHVGGACVSRWRAGGERGAMRGMRNMRDGVSHLRNRGAPPG